MWRLLCCLSLLVSLRADEIRGIVRDALTREPLSRVALTCGAARAETSAGGRFSVTCTTPPLTAATVGYRAFTVTEFPKEAELEIELFPAALRRQESVTVSAGPLGAETPGSATLQGVELENLASVLADDPLRAAQALPGVVANDDFSAALSLRGAGFDRVGLYYDGILVRQPFHSVQGESTSGSLTIFNSDLLEALQLYPSAPPLRLPDRTAGALDLQPRDGDRRKLSTRFTASASNAAALVEGPLPKGSWLAAVRQSYLQYIIERTAPDNASLAFGFTDGQARLRRDLTARHSAVVNLTAGQSGGDRSRLARTAGANTLIESDYRFTLASLSLRSQWNESVTSTITAAHLRERAENRNREGSALYGSDYRESVVNAAASAGLRASGVLEFGASFRRMRDDGFVYRYTFVPATVRPLDRFRGAGLRSAGFAQAGRGFASGRLLLTAGVRADGHSVGGPAALAPYGSAALQILPASRLHATVSEAAQYPDIAEWFSLFGSAALLPQRARHAVAGFDQGLGTRTRLRAEAWWRWERDLLWRPQAEARIDAGAIVPPRPDAPYENSARAQGRGWQLVLERRSANGFGGWFAYAWSRTEWRDGRLCRVFPSDFDQRHTVQAFVNWRLRASVNLSGRAVYGTGLPVPGFFRGTLAAPFLNTERNALRFPDYRRADARVNKLWQRGRLRWTLFGEVINFANWRNQRFDANNGFDARTGRARLSFLSMFPVLPSAGVLVEF